MVVIAVFVAIATSSRSVTREQRSQAEEPAAQLAPAPAVLCPSPAFEEEPLLERSLLQRAHAVRKSDAADADSADAPNLSSEAALMGQEVSADIGSFKAIEPGPVGPSVVAGPLSSLAKLLGDVKGWVAAAEKVPGATEKWQHMTSAISGAKHATTVSTEAVESMGGMLENITASIEKDGLGTLFLGEITQQTLPLVAKHAMDIRILTKYIHTLAADFIAITGDCGKVMESIAGVRKICGEVKELNGALGDLDASALEAAKSALTEYIPKFKSLQVKLSGVDSSFKQLLFAQVTVTNLKAQFPMVEKRFQELASGWVDIQKAYAEVVKPVLRAVEADVSAVLQQAISQQLGKRKQRGTATTTAGP